jgi:hypothetical protein
MAAATRNLVMLASFLTLSSCLPVFTLSLYNNSGRDLSVLVSAEERIAWGAGEYLTFENLWNTIIRFENSNTLALEVSDAEARDYKYLFEINRAEMDRRTYYLRYIRSANPAETDERADISSAPPNSRDCMRIDPDMNIYWFGSKCRMMSLGDAVFPEQPGIFPVRPVE